MCGEPSFLNAPADRYQIIPSNNLAVEGGGGNICLKKI